MPEVLLLILSNNRAIVGDEVSYIPELGTVLLYNRAGDNAYVELFGERLISVEILLPLRTEWNELRVIRKPIR